MFKIGDSVIVTPRDGPLPNGIPYRGYSAVVVRSNESKVNRMYKVRGIMGIISSVLFEDELRIK